MKTKAFQVQDELAFYREIVDNVPACIYINELFIIDGKFELHNVWSNEYAHQFIGYSRTEINRMGPAFFNAVLHPDDLQMIEFSNYDIDLNTIKRFNLQRLKPKNSDNYRWFYGYTSVIGWFENGIPCRFLNFAMEIGKQIGSENQLICLLKEAHRLRNQLLTEKLTKRQKEILGLIARGKRDREIAGQLFISLATAKTHRNLLLKKLSLKNSASLAAFAVECGF